MINKKSFLLIGLLFGAILVFTLGPQPPQPILDPTLPSLSLTAPEAGEFVKNAEEKFPNIRPGNASQVFYANEETKGQTDYSLLYLHGFSASPQEGYPSHISLGKAFGMNTYLPRLAEHGLETPDALLNMTPDRLWDSAKEALAIAKALGKKVILMGTSTGGTLALQLAADFPNDIAAVILYSPNVRIATKASFLLARPFGLHLGRLIMGGKYCTSEKDSATEPFWYKKYRVESIVYLQQLVEKTMTVETFKKITQPVFVAYYYKDEKNQDKTVSVPAILWMFENLGTTSDKKVAQAFPEAGTHVIGCELTNPHWKNIYDAASDFLKDIVGLSAIQL